MEKSEYGQQEEVTHGERPILVPEPTQDSNDPLV